MENENKKLQNRLFYNKLRKCFRNDECYLKKRYRLSAPACLAIKFVIHVPQLEKTECPRELVAKVDKRNCCTIGESCC